MKLRIWTQLYYAADVMPPNFTYPVATIAEAITALEVLTHHSLHFEQGAPFCGLEYSRDGTDWKEWVNASGETILEIIEKAG